MEWCLMKNPPLSAAQITDALAQPAAYMVLTLSVPLATREPNEEPGLRTRKLIRCPTPLTIDLKYRYLV